MNNSRTVKVCIDSRVVQGTDKWVTILLTIIDMPNCFTDGAASANQSWNTMCQRENKMSNVHLLTKLTVESINLAGLKCNTQKLPTVFKSVQSNNTDWICHYNAGKTQTFCQHTESLMGNHSLCRHKHWGIFYLFSIQDNVWTAHLLTDLPSRYSVHYKEDLLRDRGRQLVMHFGHYLNAVLLHNHTVIMYKLQHTNKLNNCLQSLCGHTFVACMQIYEKLATLQITPNKSTV